MKPLNIRLLIIMILFCGMQTLSAQTETTSIVYTYDAAGNRISRQISISKVKKLDSLKNEITGITDNLDSTDTFANNTTQQLTETIGNKQISVFPNPTDGLLQVNITNLDIYDHGEIILSGVNGAELLKIKTLQTTNIINISDKPNGLFMMKVLLNGKETVWKIVKN